MRVKGRSRGAHCNAAEECDFSINNRVAFFDAGTKKLDEVMRRWSEDISVYL